MRIVLIIRTTAACFCMSPLAGAALLPVDNGSFESPSTSFVVQAATGWTLAGPPESAISGVFNNNTTQPGDPAHIINAEGQQLAFIGTETGNEMTQFIGDSSYQAGTQYQLSVGIALSNTLRPRATDAMRIALYFVDGGDARHMVALSDIVNSPENGLATNALTYFTALSPVLLNDDPAVGRPIGMQLSTIGASGRYFDLDDVTLDAQAFAIGEEALVLDYPAPLPERVSVPEPAMLPAAGAAAALLFRRGRKHPAGKPMK